jgi:hypothetical protein
LRVSSEDKIQLSVPIHVANKLYISGLLGNHLPIKDETLGKALFGLSIAPINTDGCSECGCDRKRGSDNSETTMY